MTFGEKLLKRKSKENSRVIETQINTEQFKQHIEAFLHASRFINNDDNVTDITFQGSLSSTIPIKIYLKKGAVQTND